jgi:toxin-antitoxin system PIN domain toxin
MKMAKTKASVAAPVYLLDVNVLIALAWPQHVHHALAHQWFDRYGKQAWATCPLTELAFVRISSNPKIIADAVAPRAATNVLAQMIALAGHVFWPADLPVNGLAAMDGAAFTGHRQVTDAYLIELARHHGGSLATLDAGLAELMPTEERGRRVTLIQ